MFRRILVANRGEIAVRIIRACRELGIEAAAIYSDADARSPHVALADLAVRIGPAPPSASYLSIDAVIAAAEQIQADAIHPGYGFLSENARFAAACEDRRIVFIGPPSDVIERMGSKIAARQVAAAAGVPVVPGQIPADQSDDAIAEAARRLGFPVLVKPSEGGGGIGMKVVREASTLPFAIAQARHEAAAAFGNGMLYVERLLDRPRHVEIQVLADHEGRVVHLFERECSLQRRQQKIVEESPSTVLTPALRARMGIAAVAVARAAGYRNAGTVEFLVEESGEQPAFYFLEMNTRLQVEHPVTEEVTGIDLVHAQIDIAAGQKLRWTQEQLTQRHHAIEVRIYAEDPTAGHLPQAGRLLLYREPVMPGIRLDSGVAEGSDVTVYYDPLLSKLIATGDSRETARRRAIAALRNYPILGIRTNVSFLIAVLEHPRFIAGDLDVRLLETEDPALQEQLNGPIPPEVLAVARAADAAGAGLPHATKTASDPWVTLRGYRG